MKNLLAGLLLGATLLGAQVPIHKPPCRVTRSETIPDDAVEPIHADNYPFCPRDEYELKWFVVEAPGAEDYTYHPIYTHEEPASGYWVKDSGKTYMIFKPMCILKETK